MNLADIDLIKLQTRYMRSDTYTNAFCEGITPEFRKAAELISNLLLWLNTDNLPENVLDQLANDLSVKWYDFGASREIKAKTVKDAIIIHQHKGTKYALEKAVTDYFGDGYVEEWFEYGGEPFMFTITTSSADATTEKVIQFNKIIEYCKNARSKLEAIIIKTNINKSVNTACFVNVKVKYSIG